VSYLVADPATKKAAIVDPVLDYDHKSGKANMASANAILEAARQEGYAIEWVLETHAHADHLSSAPYIKLKTGAKVGIGEHIRDVQKIFRPVFDAQDVSGDGTEFDRLFKDGERFTIGEMDVEVFHVPGHTPADIAYKIADAVFVGDTLFMPDYGTARADFPGGDARTLYRSIQKLLTLAPGARSLCVGDDRRRGAQQRAPQGRRDRGCLRRHARSPRRQALRAHASPAFDPGQYPRRPSPAARCEWGALSQDTSKGCG
jgi:glyoxylase-like metal-dependent hydrolase (beta-lactamase superfamily II)